MRKAKSRSVDSISEAKKESKPALLESIDNFKNAAKVWEKNNNYPQLLPTLEIISDIYHMLELPKKELVILERAYIKAGKIKNKALQIKLKKRITKVSEKFNLSSDMIDSSGDLTKTKTQEISIKSEQKQQPKIVESTTSVEKPKETKSKSLSDQYKLSEITGTKDTLDEIDDEYTIIAKKHIKQGRQALDEERLGKASMEFVNALNILKRRKIPSMKEVEALEMLVKINTDRDDINKVKYYTRQLQDLKQKLTNS